MANMAMPLNIPTEPVALHHPVLDAPLLPLRPVLGSYTALQLCRERRRVAVDVFEEPPVPHPMKVVGMTAKDHVPHVAALVLVVCNMQGLVHVADEMNHEFEGLCLSVLVRVRVFQDGEELFSLGDYAITVTALAGQIEPRIG